MIVSVVEGEVWKRCRRQWYLTAESGEGLEPVHKSPALQLGGLVQLTLSEWTEKPDIDPMTYFFEESNKAILVVKEHYENNVGAPISDVELGPLYDTINLGAAMIENYIKHYDTPTPKEYNVIQTEQRMLVSIPNTEHWECNECHTVFYEYQGAPNMKLACANCLHDKYLSDTVTWQPHYLRATIDTLLQSKKTGRLCPVERKTYERRPEFKMLQHNDQMLAYWWAVDQLYPGQVGGMLYDGLWKRAQPPRGKTFNDLFYRDIFIRPPQEIEEYGIHLVQLIDDMVYAQQKGNMFINRKWDGCWDCGVEKVCAAISRGEDVDYVKAQYYKKRDFSTAPQLVTVEDE